jgi:hypothetical protein
MNSGPRKPVRKMLLGFLEPQIKTALFPDLTLFRHTSSCRVSQQKLWSSERTTNNRQNNCSPSHGGFPNVLIATSLAISKQSTFLTPCKHERRTWRVPTYSTLYNKSSTIGAQQSPFQISISCHFTGEHSLIRHRTSQPTHQGKPQRHTQ